MVPSGTGLMVALRPSDIVGKPGFEALAEFIGPQGEITKQIGIPAAQVEQVTMVWLGPVDPARRGGGPMLPSPTAVIVRTLTPHDWKGWTDELLAKRPQKAEFAGVAYTRKADAADGPAYFRPDDRTLVVSERETALQSYLMARTIENPKHAWEPAWKATAEGQIGMAIDTAYLLQVIRPSLEPVNVGASPDMFSPLWTKTYAHALKLNADKTLSLDFVSACGNDDGARPVAKTLEALVTLASNSLSGLTRQNANIPPTMVEMVNVANEAMESARVERDGRMVHLRGTAKTKVVELVRTVFLPAVGAARSAARRSTSVNNMKQLGLAMHNYASAHENKFPPAVIMGPDGKTTHSWRVELLPYLEQQQLYDAYKMDEPWDSPANRKVMESRPATFAYPDSDIDPTHTSYFALTGPETLFPKEGQGTRFADVLDGLSNTVLLVEAKRSIPWTKPEDIPLIEGQPMPDLGTYQPQGGGNDVLLADGSVKFFARTIDPSVFRKMATKAGGEIITFP